MCATVLGRYCFEMSIPKLLFTSLYTALLSDRLQFKADDTASHEQRLPRGALPERHQLSHTALAKPQWGLPMDMQPLLLRRNSLSLFQHKLSSFFPSVSSSFPPPLPLFVSLKSAFGGWGYRSVMEHFPNIRKG